MNNPIFLPPVSPLRLPEVARESREILEGAYDHASNFLILDVEVTLWNEIGQEIGKKNERRYFEVNSLKIGYKNKGDQSPLKTVQLIGARTDEAMKKVMPLLIENMQKHIDQEIFFSNNSDRFTKKEITFAKEPDFGTSSEAYVSETISNTLEFVSDRWRLKQSQFKENDSIADSQTLRMLLNYSNFESMIQEVEASQTSHKWDTSSRIIQVNPLIDKVVNAYQKLVENPNENYAILYSKLADKKEAASNFIENIQSQIGQIESYRDQNLNTLPPLGLPLISSGLELLNDALKDAKTHLKQIEQSIFLHQDLAVMGALREVNQNLFYKGQAPIGVTLTRDFNKLISQYGLVPYDTFHVEDENQVDYIKTHLLNKLGSSLIQFEYEALFNNLVCQIEGIPEAIEEDRLEVELEQARIENENRIIYNQQRFYQDQERAPGLFEMVDLSNPVRSPSSLSLSSIVSDDGSDLLSTYSRSSSQASFYSAVDEQEMKGSPTVNSEHSLQEQYDKGRQFLPVEADSEDDVF